MDNTGRSVERKEEGVKKKKKEKRKAAMYSAFVLIIPRRLGDIQAASVPRLWFGRRVISGSAGECFRIARVQSGRLPSCAVLGNVEKDVSGHELSTLTCMQERSQTCWREEGAGVGKWSRRKTSRPSGVF